MSFHVFSITLTQLSGLKLDTKKTCSRQFHWHFKRAFFVRKSFLCLCRVWLWTNFHTKMLMKLTPGRALLCTYVCVCEFLWKREKNREKEIEKTQKRKERKKLKMVYFTKISEVTCTECFTDRSNLNLLMVVQF